VWKSILGFLSSPLTAWVEGKASRDYMKAEGALAITKAKVAVEVAVMEGKAQRALLNTQVDADYDMAAQSAKRDTIADEILIVCTIILVASHFFFPESMDAGWEAMGYVKPPWWLEFIIVGIFVSVFGLMRLFRAFNPFNRKKEKSDG
jgi:protein-S-isoprenylcysteine O-methyltransferase Ste14